MTPEVKQRIEQIRQGIVPEGYKKTKAGILPESWSVRTIAECLERVEHPVEVQANECIHKLEYALTERDYSIRNPLQGTPWAINPCFGLNLTALF